MHSIYNRVAKIMNSLLPFKIVLSSVSYLTTQPISLAGQSELAALFLPIGDPSLIT